MTKKVNKAKRGKDKYYHLAKEQGFRARSAFKLIQLNRKYDFLTKAHVLIDLCAAPGGWCQVAAKYMPSGSTIIGVDLMPIKAIRGVITHTEDITTPSCRTLLKRDLGGKKADVVLHDGAPNVGQNWIKDAFGQSELVLHSLRLATEFLRPRGIFITKVFRSADYNSLLWVFQQLFAKVEATKPHSSRNASAEIFVVCKDYKAPDRIDPRLLDIKYVFKEVEDMTGSGTGLAGGVSGGYDIFHKKATDRQRQRDGYDDNLGPLLTRRVSVMQFIRAKDPIRVLTDVSTFTFDQAAIDAGINDSQYTTEEIKVCCEDLKVLGKKEFKELLKWRLRIRHAFPNALVVQRDSNVDGGDDDNDDDNAEANEDEEDNVAPTNDNDDDDEDDDDEEEQAELNEKLGEVAASELSRRKREAKRTAKARQQAMRRQRLGMNLRSVDMLDTDDSLFSLAKLRKYTGNNKEAINDLIDVNLDEEDASMFDTLNQDDNEHTINGVPIDGDENDDNEDSNDEELDDEEVMDAVNSGDLFTRLRAKDKLSRLDSMEDELDTMYSRAVATRAAQEEQAKQVAESGKASHGIKLSRRDRLERQALLTEAALNKRLDAEHERYLRLLGGVRDHEVVPMEALEAIKKRKRAIAGLDSDDDDNGDSGSDDDEDEDDHDDEDAEESEDIEEDEENDVKKNNNNDHQPRTVTSTTTTLTSAKPVAPSARASRWFSQDLFADAQADETLNNGLSLSSKPKSKKSNTKLAESSDEDEEEENRRHSSRATTLSSSTQIDSKSRIQPKKGKKKGNDKNEDDEEEYMSVDSEGNEFPDWLKGIEKSDRVKWREKLRKQREREEKRQKRNEIKDSTTIISNGIEIVPAGKAAIEDIDDDFERIVAQEIRGLRDDDFDNENESDDAGTTKKKKKNTDDDDRYKKTQKQLELIKAGMGKSAHDDTTNGDDDNTNFKIVPTKYSPYDDDSDDDSDNDSDDSESTDPREANYDSDTHAEILALGKQLKKHSTAKALLDASYNRYSFADDNLPVWFANDENRHFKPQLPVPREEIEAIKNRFRDIAARPIHKVMEARARKKRRLQTQIEKAKKQVENIAEDEDLQGRSKAKAIAKAFRNAEQKRPDSVYVVAGKGSSGSQKKGARTKFVDPRMKKEKRAVKRRNKKMRR